MSVNVDDLLNKRWIHSHEEDTADSKVFRPDTYNFPPSRGRFSFELKAGGRAVIHRIGATDRSQTEEGTWRVEDDSLVLSSGAERKPDVVFNVLSGTPDRLEVKK